MCRERGEERTGEEKKSKAVLPDIPIEADTVYLFLIVAPANIQNWSSMLEGL